MMAYPISTLFGGPSQPEPTDPRGGIQRAQQMAEEGSEVVNPNQYINQAVSIAVPINPLLADVCLVKEPRCARSLDW